MKTHNFFNFFPVGQGLFYCGLLGEGQYSFVYDCGTETSSVNLKTYINFLFRWNGNRQIDFVAISHFHRDHISGIRDLERLIGFKNIYLPYICSSKTAREFLIGASLFNILDEEGYDDVDNGDVTLFETYIYLLNLYNRDGVITAETYKDVNIYNWEFKFFNKPISKVKEAQLVFEIDSLMKKEGVTKVIDLFHNDKIDDARKVYRNVFGGSKLNDTSLILLHHPSFNGVAPTTSYYPNIYGMSLSKPFSHYFYPYTLLTGDILFDASLATTITSQYPAGISGFVQVPHHGSKHNWSQLITYFKKFNCYIVPYGTTNHYGHPDPLLKSSISPTDYFEVNEYAGFPYWIYN